MFRKLSAFLLACAMLLSLCACGGKGSAASDGGSAAPAAEAMLSPEKTKVSVGGVTVDAGPFTLDGEAVLTVEKLPEESDAEAGWKIEPYDISVGDQRFCLLFRKTLGFPQLVE